MTTVANYRSIFTNNNIDDSKGLYETTKLVATQGGSGDNLPFIFFNLVGDNQREETAIIQQAPSTIDQIDADNNGIITSAVESYIKHLGSGDFNQIPTSPETGFGYIESHEKLTDEIKPVSIKGFIEKPNLEMAKNLILDRRFSWNSGMFLFKVCTIINEFKNKYP